MFKQVFSEVDIFPINLFDLIWSIDSPSTPPPIRITLYSCQCTAPTWTFILCVHVQAGLKYSVCLCVSHRLFWCYSNSGHLEDVCLLLWV